MNKPELVAPAGSLSKLKMAVRYGADALYLSGEMFGLRTAADNFTYGELREGLTFAHKHGVRCYITLNGFLHDKDLEALPEFIDYLKEVKADGVIVSDLGVLKTVKKYSNLPIHISTQASSVNSYSALLWKEFGAKRVVVGRELSVKEASKVKREAAIEVEMFIHGAMCMSYSGHCTISNYTQGRDSNRGGCAHSCRFDYSLESNGVKKIDYFMSSKDLCAAPHIKSFTEEGIDALKIEGRMKGPLYLATTLSYYRKALDEETPPFGEISKISHREYTDASLLRKADESSIYHKRDHDEPPYDFAGVIVDTLGKEHLLIDVASHFSQGDLLEIIPFRGSAITHKVDYVRTIFNREVLKSRPGSVVKIPFVSGAEKGMAIRVRRER